jgi:hypothetical protein
MNLDLNLSDELMDNSLNYNFSSFEDTLLDNDSKYEVKRGRPRVPL